MKYQEVAASVVEGSVTDKEKNSLIKNNYFSEISKAPTIKVRTSFVILLLMLSAFINA